MGGCGPVWKPAWCPGHLLVRSHNPFSAALATVPGLGARQPLQLVRKRSSAFADGSRNACYRAQLVRELAPLFRLSENLHHFEGRRADGGVICRHPPGLVLVEE